jgi:putative phosphoribosyl transferase
MIARDSHEACRTLEVAIAAGPVELPGTLRRPGQTRGVVVFAHGSGSSRLSPRNQQVAEFLNQRGMSTLLFDLLTPREEREDEATREWRFDIPFLGRRLVAATKWLREQPSFGDLPIGYFGASTGGAAALVAAAELGDMIQAIVSRGGRPDLAGSALRSVVVPTLLIVGGADHAVLALNREALDQLQGKNQLAVIPGATHLFVEPGALEQVANLAAGWFEEHFRPT